jgi:hypothetical protein
MRQADQKLDLQGMSLGRILKPTETYPAFRDDPMQRNEEIAIHLPGIA